MWKSEKYQNEDVKTWDGYFDIPASDSRKLMVLLKKS
jgi:hypothetical protein